MKGIVILVLISACICSAITAFGDITGSKHDLTRDKNIVYTQEPGMVCVFCHTPYSADTGAEARPLWVKQREDTGNYSRFFLYTWSTDIDETGIRKPSGSSLICLSCHDGTIGRLLPYNFPADAPSWKEGPGHPGDAYDPFLFRSSGTNFPEDHPVSIAYDPQKAGLAALETAGSKGMTFYGEDGDQVECASCHDTHSAENIFFLKKPIWDLCVSCHEKRSSGRHVLVAFGFGDSHPIRGIPDPLREKREFSCTSCHDPHASKHRTHDADKEPYKKNLCLKCHKKIYLQQ